MQKLSCKNLFVLFVAFLLISPYSSVQAANAPTPNISTELQSLNIPYHEGEIIIDGDLDEALWSSALLVDLNIVNNPWDNLPSPVKTTAKLIENGKFLYISFIASDPEPNKIQGFFTDRDNAWAHDLVGIKLDTHNNRRLNYEFFVNPYGVQNDATFNEITGSANTSWDGLWYSFGKKTEQGYQVEIAIPYNILNFKNDGQQKKWAIELVRTYPRDTNLRISHVPLNRDNPCWLCQYPEAVGFENAKIGKNLRLTPTLTATRNESRDINAGINEDASNWSNEDDVEAGLDIRWGINANNLFNATLNPDFSTVESDSAQLSVNTNFSLFYEEKRAFFLDNSDYFSSDFNLVYTRNIADPDYGAKLTGRVDKHSYGIFATNDTETNILLPGNLGSRLATLDQKSNSSALRYRYDFDENLTIGSIATLRSADDYHNYVFGADARYRLSESNTIKAQVLNSDTLYSDDIASSEVLKSFLLNNADSNDNSFTDQAFKVNFNHNSEYWLLDLDHQSIGEGFRADLGFMPKSDIKTDQVQLKRTFYSEQDSQWQEAGISGKWKIIHNTNNELIERALTASFNIDGPLQSVLEVDLIHAEKVGLRYDDTITDIDGNTSSFNENQLKAYSSAYLNNRTFVSLELTVGDKIDYSNDRLGDLLQVAGNLTVFITDHLEFDFYQTFSTLDAKDNGIDTNVYTANISELRLSYQFDVRSYLKLSLVYNNIDYTNSDDFKDLSSQLIYAYKINPQTVFFLGYSDYSAQPYDLTNLKRSDRTFFTKVSYAWAP
jgi:hypothetical protein